MALLSRNSQRSAEKHNDYNNNKKPNTQIEGSDTKDQGFM